MKTEHDHLEMLRHPERWPQGFLLPLRHRSRREPDGTMNLLGFVLPDATWMQAAPRVYVGCMYFKSMGLRLEDLPVEDFANLEALVLAGWEVN